MIKSLRAFIGMLQYDLKKCRNNITSIFITPLLTATLYFVIFGQVIGSRVGMIDQQSYALFITPGIIILNTVLSAFNGACFTFYLSKFTRSVEDIFTAPMSPSTIVLSYAGIGIQRSLITSVLVYGLSFLFTHHGIPHFLICFFCILLTSFLFSMIGMINGMLSKTFDQTATFATFILTPMIFLGGTFYSVSQLSEPWRTLTNINPIYHIIELFRYGLSAKTAPHLWSLFLPLIGLNGIIFIICYALIKRGFSIVK